MFDSPPTSTKEFEDLTDIEDLEDPPIKGHTSIVDIPVELLSLIFELLPLPSKVCFALSSKRMYRLFGTIVKDDRLVYPRLFSSKKFPIPLNRSDIPRNQLLIQLEDQRFAFCSVCLKLHPRFLNVLKEHRIALQFQMVLNHDGQRHLVHNCVVTDNVDAFIRFKSFTPAGGEPSLVMHGAGHHGGHMVS
ncbi:hypothetical protein HFD88_008924 [Aspergillus terreus]|nr:hypothetical protein HFD88_008924 [Aspergillus terreus]